MEHGSTSLIKALNNFENVYLQLREGFSLSSDEDIREARENRWTDKDIDGGEFIEDNKGEKNNSDEEEQESLFSFDGYEDTYSTEENHYSPITEDWVSESDYQSDCEETLNGFLRLLLELSFSIRHGDIKTFKFKLDEVKELLNNDFLSEQLYKTIGKDSDDVSSILFSVTECINFDEYFENEINTLPKNISELTEEILFQISKYPELIHELDPRLFEELISKIFVKFKMGAQLTKRTRDGGFDIVAVEDTLFSKNSYIIECKRYIPQKKVSIDIVQRLYGVKQSSRVTKAFLVTSSSFTKPAIEWAKQHCWELELKDYNDIAYWLKAFWHR